MVIAVYRSGQFTYSFAKRLVSNFILLARRCRNRGEYDACIRLAISLFHARCGYPGNFLVSFSILEGINKLSVGDFLFDHIPNTFREKLAEPNLRLVHLFFDVLVNLCHTL